MATSRSNPDSGPPKGRRGGAALATIQVFGAVQDLVTDPATLHPFVDFRAEHFCDGISQSIVAAEQQQ
jgi:hypothetical protein